MPCWACTQLSLLMTVALFLFLISHLVTSYSSFDKTECGCALRRWGSGKVGRASACIGSMVGFRC